MRNRIIYFLFLFFIANTFAFSQMSDAGIWAGLTLKHKTDKDIRLSASTESRFAENATFYEKQNYDAEVGYPIGNLADASVCYRFSTENNADNSPSENSHRISLDIAKEKKFERIAIKARARWQSGWAKLYNEENKHLPDHTMRAKLSSEYKIYGSRFTPTVSAETFFPIEANMPIALSKIRVSAGTDMTISKHTSLNIAYLYQTDTFTYPASSKHIIAIGLAYKL